MRFIGACDLQFKFYLAAAGSGLLVLLHGAAIQIFVAEARKCSEELCAPPAGLEPAIFGLEVRRLVH